jgi:hypothetical protein
MPYFRVLPLLLAALSLQAQPYRAGVDPRVELMSIIFRLAGNNEYSQGRVPAYNQAIDRHFGPFRDHAAVQLARELHQHDGVSFDAVANMAVQVKDVETLAERIPFDSPASRLEPRWHGVKARRFLEQARKFAADTNFAAFLKSEQPLYDLTNSRLRALIDQHADLAWFDRFFGARAKARFIIIPGLVNGGSSYGASITAEDGVQEIYAIPGVWNLDGDGQPRFDAGWVPTLVHEFAHSYVAPLLAPALPQLQTAGDRLLAPVHEQMNRQAYDGAKTVLEESVVRASTARYIFDHEGAEAAARAVNYERARSFLWTGELFDLLGEYQKDRARYPTLDLFLPRMVTFFNDVSGRADKMARDYEGSRPKVVSMTISDGAQDVDPALREMVIRFDRPMQKSYSLIPVGNFAAPDFGAGRFDEAATALRLPVTLQPGKEYAFSLNMAYGGSFQSADGVALRYLPIKFRTRQAASSPAALTEPQKQALQQAAKTGESELKTKEAQIKEKLVGIVKGLARDLLSATPDPELERKLSSELADAISKVLAEAINVKLNQTREMVKLLTPEQKKLLLAELDKPDANPDLTELIGKVLGGKK